MITTSLDVKSRRVERGLNSYEAADRSHFAGIPSGACWGKNTAKGV